MINFKFLIVFIAFFLCKDTILAQDNKLESQKKYQLKLSAYDFESNESLEGAYLKLYNIAKKRVEDSAIVTNGFVNFTLTKGFDYNIIGQKKRYMSRKTNFNAACYLIDPNKVFCVSGIEIGAVSKQENNTDLIEGTIAMKKIKVNETFKIENIRYDLNKWLIRPDAAKELDVLVGVLKENPEIIVELGSHTDCRSSDVYNLNLSQKRAEAAVEYIKSKGKIAQNRITAKGYGETKLLNKCDDGIPCNEELHSINRRTEVRITGTLEDGKAIDMSGGQKK